MPWETHFKPILMNREYVRDLVFAYLRSGDAKARQLLSEIRVEGTAETVLDAIERVRATRH